MPPQPMAEIDRYATCLLLSIQSRTPGRGEESPTPISTNSSRNFRDKPEICLLVHPRSNQVDSEIDHYSFSIARVREGKALILMERDEERGHRFWTGC